MTVRRVEILVNKCAGVLFKKNRTGIAQLTVT